MAAPYYNNVMTGTAGNTLFTLFNNACVSVYELPHTKSAAKHKNTTVKLCCKHMKRAKQNQFTRELQESLLSETEERQIF